MSLNERTIRRIQGQTSFDPQRYESLGFTLWERQDSWSGGLVEAICEHGVGHPIPESITERNWNGPIGSKGTWGVHGCDGCCKKFREKGDESVSVLADKPLEYEYCSHCKEHAEFAQGRGGTWRSVCCGAPPIPVDVEPPEDI